MLPGGKIEGKLNNANNQRKGRTMGNAGFNLEGGTGSDENGTGGSEGQAGKVGGGSGGTSGAGVGPESVLGGSPSAASIPERAAGEPAPKKRGRKALPRDENGNIIRNDTETGTANASGKDRLSVNKEGKFKGNDRAKVRMQIAGLHMAAAMLSGFHPLALTDEEATALTASLCDVLDYHEIDLFASGGNWGLYASLIITAFKIYNPRLRALNEFAKHKALQKNGAKRNPPAPTGLGQVDFSGDIAN
jgi:hypothetical protein